MNQRAHIRHQVEMPASLSFGNIRQRECCVQDFCLGGMLLYLPPASEKALIALTTDDHVVVNVQVQGLRGLREISLPARVRRREQGSLGVAFESPQATDLLAVQNHVRSLTHAGGEPAPGRKQALDRETVSRATAVLVEALRTFAVRSMERFLPAAREALLAAADKMTTNEAQHPWFEAHKILGQQAERLARNFIANACRKLEDMAQGIAPAGEEGASTSVSSRLALVDKDMFEDWLTLKVMATRAEGRFHEPLLHLQLRLDELFGIALSARRNPLHPVVICTAFGEALRLLPLKQKTDRVILATFEAEVAGKLGELYAEANIGLCDVGVLPDLDVGRYISERYGHQPQPSNPAPQPEAPQAFSRAHAGHRAESSPIRATAVTAEPMPEHPAAPAVTPPPEMPPPAPAPPRSPSGVSLSARQFTLQQHIARHAYETVHKLLSVRSMDVARERSAQRPRSVLPPADDTRVEEALAQLQRSLDEHNDALLDQVQEAVNSFGEAPVALGPELQAAAEVIQHLFMGMAANPALTPRVQAAIRRLQVPFLRLLLIDDSFLSHDQHPARQLLNRVAHLGVRGSANVQAHEQEIDQEVEGIVEGFDNDISIFQDSLEKLDKIAARQQALYLRNIRRVTESCEGKQKLLQARREVDQALERRIGGKRTPKAALSLIDAGWRQLLVQSLLRGGRDSREWHENLGVIDKLLHAATQVPSQAELTSLLATIKAGLAQVDHTQMQNARLIAELRDLLSSRARNEAGPMLVDVPAGVVGAEEEPLGAGDEVLQRWIRRARQHDVGDWFSHFDNGQEVMLRLAWVDPEKETFVFVNHQGMKIVEHRVDVLAGQLARGEMQRIDDLDAPAVDRGLEAMVQRVYDQMAHQATHDDLTGLLNRREFERRLRERLGSYEGTGAVLHLDIDQFKVVNNYGGPEAGDQMIEHMARLVRDVFASQAVARLSGDEFAIWVENVPLESARKVADSFRRRVAEERFRCAGHSFSVTVSCGLAHRSGMNATASGLLRDAGSACLAAKECGRNRVQVYTPDDRELAKRDDVMGWVTRLNEAIDQDRLLLRCQRIESTVPGQGAPAYEVLISIAGPDGEVLAPAEFLHAAERYNRMHALDRWVVGSVLRWMHEHPAVVERLDHLSINLSGHSLNDPGLLEFLFEHFQRYPVPRERLCFEVTETAAIANLEDAADFIRELQGLGCRFSLDDFGSGLASYGHLKHLPVDYIKIDGSFIRDVADDAAGLALVRSINEMGHLMGKRTIAEYVENERIRECLRDIGVDYVQGFGVEQPRPLASLVPAAG